jgi:hypothetical protein
VGNTQNHQQRRNTTTEAASTKTTDTDAAPTAEASSRARVVRLASPADVGGTRLDAGTSVGTVTLGDGLALDAGCRAVRMAAGKVEAGATSNKVTGSIPSGAGALSCTVEASVSGLTALRLARMVLGGVAVVEE